MTRLLLLYLFTVSVSIIAITIFSTCSSGCLTAIVDVKAIFFIDESSPSQLGKAFGCSSKYIVLSYFFLRPEVGVGCESRMREWHDPAGRWRELLPSSFACLCCVHPAVLMGSLVLLTRYVALRLPPIMRLVETPIRLMMLAMMAARTPRARHHARLHAHLLPGLVLVARMGSLGRWLWKVRVVGAWGWAWGCGYGEGGV